MLIKNSFESSRQVKVTSKYRAFSNSFVLFTRIVESGTHESVKLLN